MSTKTFDIGEFAGGIPVPLECVFVTLVAVVHLGATVATWYLLELAAFDAFVIAVPSLCMLAFIFVLLSGPQQEATVTETFRWTTAGVGVLGGSIAAVLLLQGRLSLASAPLLLFITGIGGVGGLLVGYSRGNSIAAQRRAMELESQQDRLVFLNQLLRHNVLNNIAIIKGNADMIADDHDLESPRFETIRNRSEAVTELVDNVRLLVRVFHHQPALRAQDLSTTLREELTGLKQAYPAVEWTERVADDLTVVGDPLLRYVFENVLRNAVQHNDAETPHVTVEARQVADHVEVSITDNGPGIPQTIIDEIETENYDVKHGVGLYLVDVLLDRYDGDLEFQENEPHGTVVTLTFQTPSHS